MTDDQLTWHIEWRKNIRSAMRLWLNASGYRDGCDRLADLKAVLNEQPPSTEIEQARAGAQPQEENQHG